MAVAPLPTEEVYRSPVRDRGQPGPQCATGVESACCAAGLNERLLSGVLSQTTSPRARAALTAIINFPPRASPDAARSDAGCDASPTDVDQPVVPAIHAHSSGVADTETPSTVTTSIVVLSEVTTSGAAVVTSSVAAVVAAAELDEVVLHPVRAKARAVTISAAVPMVRIVAEASPVVVLDYGTYPRDYCKLVRCASIAPLSG